MTAMMRTNHFRNIFSGPRALKDFFNPEKNVYIPLVEVPPALNPLYASRVHLYAKLMHVLPLANVKSLAAYGMLEEYEKKGTTYRAPVLIEKTSGNTAFSLAVLGRLFGFPTTKAIVSHGVPWGKVQLLRFFGVEVFVNKEPAHMNPRDARGGIAKAKRMARERGWVHLGQYENEANPRAHERWIAPQILDQTRKKISLFAAGMGTAGTIVGVSRALKRAVPRLVTLGVTEHVDASIPGVRNQRQLDMAFGWKKHVDHVVDVGTVDAYAQSLELCRQGILAGPSSGLAFAGLLNFLRQFDEERKLDVLRNKDGDLVAVFVCPDGPFPYLDEYFRILDPQMFPRIDRAPLLVHRPRTSKHV